MHESDAAAVAEILREAPEAVFWPEASVKEVLAWEGALTLVADSNGRVIAFLIARQTADEAEILNLAVARANRRKGEGGALLIAAVNELHAQGAKRVFLEVRDSNAAGIAFYKKLGFCEAGRRPGYYRDPAEAAIVLEKNLSV